MSLYSATFYTSDLDYLFSEKGYIECMLKVESALAEAQAIHGVIPDSAYHRIKEVCDRVDHIDIEKIKHGIASGGNAVIPLVKQISAYLNSIDPPAAQYVHLGATSQDIVDTATILLIKDYINWFGSQLSILLKLLYKLTSKHKNTVMIGRTLLQQARPITFGLKSGYWLDAIVRLYKKLEWIKPDLLKVQLGGAVGTTNLFISKKVRKSFSEILGLQDSLPWHTNRINIGEWAGYLGMINVHFGKMAKDISLLMQTEIAEVSEGAEPGKGSSSTMPHKRNPVSCALIIANASRTPHLVASLYSVMSQEHERSAGLWHAEWEPMLDLMRLTAGSLTHTISLIDKLEINKSRMQENLELTQGLIYSEEIVFALTPTLGKEKANELLKSASQKVLEQNRHLKIILEEEYAEQINGLDLHPLFDPFHSLGYHSEIIESILHHAEDLTY